MYVYETVSATLKSNHRDPILNRAEAVFESRQSNKEHLSKQLRYLPTNHSLLSGISLVTALFVIEERDQED